MFQDSRELVGSAAVVATVLQFLSGILVCKQYFTNKSTSESSPLPFFSGFISCALWFEYGLLRHDDKIILVNTIGATLSCCYAIVFYMFTIKKSAVIKHFFVVLIIIIAMICYVRHETDTDLLINRLGVAACVVTLFFVASPLTKLFHVVKMKNTDCLPFPMIVMAFVVSTLWFLYGIIIADKYLQVPNFIGILLAATQLSLFALYPSRPPATKSFLS